jgi:putative ABC transport system permease protein
VTPPWLTRRFVARLAPPDVRRSLVDDLDEAFARRAAATNLRRARWWYRRQAFIGLGSLIALRLRRSPRVIRPPVDYSMNRLDLLDSLWLDLKYASRTLWRAPGFTAVAVLSLALGIGANTAVFSVVHAVLLRPLPYPEADRLVLVTPPDTVAGSVNLPQYAFWKERPIFAAAAGRNTAGDVGLSAGGAVESFRSASISTDFFRTLGVAPALGREFRADEVRAGGPAVILLSDTAWRRVFSADPEIVGKSAWINDTSYEVIGVLPKRLWLPEAVDVFFPLRPTGRLTDKGLNTQMVARLAPGVSLDEANAAMAAISADFIRANPEAPSENFRGLIVTPYQDALAGDIRASLLLLFGAVAVLLLIACSNLAGLALARLSARRAEIALRLALGASRTRLMRQLVIENAVLCLTGSLAGAAAAFWALDAVVALVPFRLPIAAPIRLDLTALGFAVAAGIATGVLLSLAPFLTWSRHGFHDALKSGGRTHGVSRRSLRARNVLVVAEVALSVVLLVGAALLAQSLYRMRQEPLGFSPEGLLVFWTPAQPASRTDPTARWRFESELIERLGRLPGVTGVAGTNVLPLDGQFNFPTERETDTADPIGGMEIRAVTPEYFALLSIALRGGRLLADSDTSSAPLVVLVNETLARRWWPGGTPLGSRLVIGRYKGKPVGNAVEPAREVVGIVADSKTMLLKARPRPTIFIPSAQASWITGGTSWIVGGDVSTDLADRVRRVIADFSPRQRVERMRSMDAVVAATMADSRFDAWLCGAFAGLALALATIGVYGLLAFSVARRTSEIGTRIALGATRVQVTRMVLRQGLVLVSAGLVIGLGAARALSRSISSLLFGVTPTDASSFVLVAGLLLAVTIAASVIPARRAARIDPLVALRYE